MKEINRTNLDEMVSTLNLTREEKIKVAGITAELKDLCTQQPTVSRMEATAAQEEVKKMLVDWGVPKAVVDRHRTSPSNIGTTVEFVAIANVLVAR